MLSGLEIRENWGVINPEKEVLTIDYPTDGTIKRADY